MKKYDDALPVGKERSSWSLLAVCIGILAVVAVLTIIDGRDDYSRRSYRDRQELPLAVRVTGFVILSAVGAFVIAGAGVGIYRMYQSAQERAHEFSHKQQVDRIALREREERLRTDTLRDALSAAHLPPYSEHGRLGALVRQTKDGWQIVNLDAEQLAVMMRNDGTVTRAMADHLAVAQLLGRQQLEEERAKASAHPQLHTYHSMRQNDIQQPALAAPAESAVNWPAMVPLRDIAPNPPSLSHLVLGVTVHDDGRQEVISLSLLNMVHGAIGGITGGGKSALMRALALQLAMAAEPCHLALIDLEGVTFSAFANANRLLWPVADSEAGAIAIVHELQEEMERRKRLYQEFPGVDNMPAYNARAGDEPLAPIACFIDEAAALLGDGAIQTATRVLAWRARKYGIGLFLGGQAWTTKHVEGGIRDMLAVRIHFRAMAASQSRVLLGRPVATEIDPTAAGRAYALLPQRGLVQLQAPWVAPDEITTALAGQAGPANDMPETPEDAVANEREGRILALAREGKSQRGIEREVYGFEGGAAYRQVRRVLSAHGIQLGEGNE